MSRVPTYLFTFTFAIRSLEKLFILLAEDSWGRVYHEDVLMLILKEEVPHSGIESGSIRS